MVERSHQLDPTPGSLFTLAECLSRLGDFVNAIKRYGEFIQHYNALPPEAAVRYATRDAASQAAALKLRGEVGKISLRLPDNPPPATRVFVDGERVPRVQMDQPVLVNPGTHVVQTRVPGMRAMSHTLQVGAREHHTLQLRIRRPVQEPPPDAQPAEPPPPPPLAPKIATTAGASVSTTAIRRFCASMTAGSTARVDEANKIAHRAMIRRA